MIDVADIVAHVESLGYHATPYSSEHTDALRRRSMRNLVFRTLVAGLAMMQVMMYAIPTYVADEGTLTRDLAGLMGWAGLVLTLPVVMFSAAPILRSAWRDSWAGRVGMDQPIALGLLVAFIASAINLGSGHGPVYFDSICMFVFALLLGRLIEQGIRVRVARRLDAMFGALEGSVTLLLGQPGGAAHFSQVANSALKAGDRILIKAGQTIPTDGVVEAGSTEVDESVLTGEAHSVVKLTGDNVYAGSVNCGNPITVRVLVPVGESTLTLLAQAADRALTEKPPLVQSADRAARWFLGGVLVLAPVAGLWWAGIGDPRALWIAISILIVTCPCALALAAPLALAAATGEIARRGVIVRNAHAIETLAKVSRLVFDKTGTLTTGVLRIELVHAFDGVDPAQALAMAARLERGFTHPIARAFPPVSGPSLVDPTTMVAGAGVQGVIDGVEYRIGRREFVGDLVRIAREQEAEAQIHAGTSVWLGRSGQWLARIDLGHSVRSGAKRLIKELRLAGIHCAILSGDCDSAVAAVANEVGVEEFAARLTPEDKRNRLAQWQAAGEVVAMVGDGVNDALVLAQADVSVAMASGTAVAQMHADAICMAGDLHAIHHALNVARNCLRIIRQNLAWALFYNVAAIPLAASGWVSPWQAGVGMALSSLFVALNAARLLRPQPVAGTRLDALVVRT